MENIRVKKEVIENSPSSSLVLSRKKNEDSTSRTPVSGPVIDLGSSSGSDSDFSSSSSSSSSDDDDDHDDVGDIIPGTSNTKSSRASGEGGLSKKKKKLEKLGVVLPAGFLDPLPVKEAEASRLPVPKAQSPKENANPGGSAVASVASCKQFWKAGDYDGNRSGDWDASSGGMDHLRVHPKFLHSNATSHKWVLGAFAELLDNAMDELGNGATLVNVDMLKSKKDGSRMLLIEDNGGGMDPDRIRHCMSLGYSVKSKAANTIGQYGNGFKTSTMRLGADVIVFSRCSGKTKKWSTQSIGLLSYTFLRSTGKEDIVVPMLDYERKGQEWRKVIRFSADEWHKNVETMVRWSPFSDEADLLQQFNSMGDQGTRIIIYNLWEDDQGLLELDFDSDPHDIQIRGVNRDERNIEMAKQFPNSRHFLTYQHSLRSYASILYLRIPAGFRIILRGKDVEHHNVVNDMMMAQEVTYRPQHGPDGAPKDQNMVAVVTIGFVKDAKAHIDVQGFNVYHKNRLIKPFWRLWHPPGSDGRGVIGVLEANFVEPAHDKQGFERTIVLSRLEAKLVQMQRTYWSTNCHKIGYAPRRNKRLIEDRDTSTDFLPETSSGSKKKSTPSSNTAVAESDKVRSFSNQKQGKKVLEKHHNALWQNHSNVQVSNKVNKRKTPGKRLNLSEVSSSSVEAVSDDDLQIGVLDNQLNSNSQMALPMKKSLGKNVIQSDPLSPSLGKDVGRHEFPSTDLSPQTLEQLKEVNRELRDRLQRKEEDILGDLLHDLQNEREMCKCLETQLEDATRKVDELNKEQESLIDTFSEERERRDIEEENLRKKLKDASNTIQELLDKVRLLE